MSATVRTMIGYAAAALVGYLCYIEHMPLAWMLGPLFTAAILSLAGFELKPRGNSRRVGQLIIGASVGLNMTAEVVGQLFLWLPLMILTTLVSVLASCVVGVALARLARIDQTTAFYASLPGGLAEMGNIGMAVGARPEPIAIVQTLRVTLIVMIVPPLLVGFDPGGFSGPLPAPNISYAWVACLFAGGGAIAFVLGKVKLNNPFTIGAILFATLLTSSGLLSGRMPAVVFFAGQLLVGFVVGSRFKREILSKMPRVTFFGSVLVLVLTVMMAGYALLLTWAIDLEFPIAMLASSPGGMSEMAATAQALHLAVPLVVAFQVIRGVLVNGFASHFHRVLMATGTIPGLQKLIGKPDEE